MPGVWILRSLRFQMRLGVARHDQRHVLAGLQQVADCPLADLVGRSHLRRLVDHHDHLLKLAQIIRNVAEVVTDLVVERDSE